MVEWAMTRGFWDICLFMVSSERSIRRVPCKGVWVTIRAAAYFSIYLDHRSHLTLPLSLGVSLLLNRTPPSLSLSLYLFLYNSCAKHSLFYLYSVTHVLSLLSILCHSCALSPLYTLSLMCSLSILVETH